MLSPATRLSLLINGLVALVTTGVSLVVLLIAPLGLASVITLTALIGVCSFAGGMLGDVVLLWALPAARHSSSASQRRGSSERGGRRALSALGLPPRR